MMAITALMLLISVACLRSSRGEEVIVCPPHQVLTSDSRCDCMESVDCPSNKFLNGDLCTCECRLPEPGVCSPNEYFDAETCQCVCKFEDCLPDNKTCDGDCFGVDNSSCPLLSHFNVETCACECDNQAGECRSPMQLNIETCECECPPSLTCSLNQKLNRETCVCECAVQKDCPSHYVWNNEKCSCECNCPCGWDIEVHASCQCRQSRCQGARNYKECISLRCGENQAKECVYIRKTNSCVCPCCVAKQGEDDYVTDWCLDLSKFGEQSCLFENNKDYCEWTS